MDWILNHLQLIIAAAGAVAWWLNQRRQAKAGVDEAPPKEQAFDDPELAGRTRRIREEIQRKIEQRTKGGAQPSSTATQREAPPIIREVVRSQAQQPAVLKSRTAHVDAQRTAEILEQQAALAERLQQAKEMKAAALRRVQFENQVSNGERVAAVSSGALTDDLRSPDALRRAFILREIIGPPVALR